MSNTFELNNVKVSFFMKKYSKMIIKVQNEIKNDNF